MNRFYTIGYGGWKPESFVETLQQNRVKTLVDVRIRPDKAHLGIYSKAKTPDKGIESLLSQGNIGYVSMVELGNLFLGYEDWERRLRALYDAAGDLLIEKLEIVPKPFCLMCCEHAVKGCHREIIAEYLQKKGWKAVHLE